MQKFITILSILFIVTLQKALASPLTELNDSPLMGKMDKVSDLANKKWFIGHPNLSNLFMTNSGIKLIPNWIGDGSGDFFSQNKYYSSKLAEKNPILQYRATYLNREREKLSLTVYVPHPKISSSIDLGLNDTINKLSPPVLKIFFEKQIDINGKKGILYLHKNGACSILMTLPSSTRLRTYKKDCKDKEELVTFTKSFDIQRLISKLTKPKTNITE